MFFPCIHACVKICVLNMCDMFNNQNDHMTRVYYFRSPKRRSVEIFARSSISPRSQIKVYFFLEKSFLIIPCKTYLSTRNLVVLFQVMFALPCILFLFKLSRNSLLLIEDPLKKGDVETLARSSVFLSPQVKTKLKLTASRQGSL